MTRWFWLPLFASAALATGRVGEEPEAAVRAGNLPRALELYRKWTETEPARPEGWIGRARLESWTRDFAAAEASYRHIHETWPEITEAWVGHVYLEIWRERFTEAALFLERAERTDPAGVGVMAVRARLFRARGQRTAARDAYARLESAWPDHPETAAVRSELDKFEPRTTISTGTALDRIVPGQPGHAAFLSARHTMGRNTFGASVSAAGRQIERPMTYEGSFTRRQGAYWLSAHASVSPGARLTAAASQGGGIARRIGNGRAANLHYSRTTFRDASVHGVSPGFESRLPGGMSASISYHRSWILRPGETAEAAGWSGRVSTDSRKRVALSIGAATSSRIVNLATVTQIGRARDQLLFGEASFRASARTRVSFSWNRRMTPSDSRWLQIGTAVTRYF